MTFERFTDRARRVVVLAGEEARLHGHNYVGREHLLLGLCHEGESLAAKSLGFVGIDVERVQRWVKPARSESSSPTTIPCTEGLKKVFELALRESLMEGRNYIGPEHLLVGWMRYGASVAIEPDRTPLPESNPRRWRRVQIWETDDADEAERWAALSGPPIPGRLTDETTEV